MYRYIYAAKRCTALEYLTTFNLCWDVEIRTGMRACIACLNSMYVHVLHQFWALDLFFPAVLRQWVILFFSMLSLFTATITLFETSSGGGQHVNKWVGQCDIYLPMADDITVAPYYRECPRAGGWSHSVQQMSHVRSFQQGIWLYVEILYIDVYIAGFDLYMYMAGRTYGGKPPPPPMTGNDVLLFIKESPGHTNPSTNDQSARPNRHISVPI